MSYTDFSSCRVSDLRKTLIKGGLTQEEVSFIKGKTELVKKIQSLGLTVLDVQVAEAENKETYVFDEETDEIPEFGSVKWHSYVMTQFEPDELDNGAPKVEGLRRVTSLLLGPIVQAGPVQVFPSTDPIGPGRATVVYEVGILHGDGSIRTFREVADSCAGNTDHQFVKFPVAIASTRAEARALRKALMIKVIAADELSNSSVTDEITNASISNMVKEETNQNIEEFSLITSQQEAIIKKLCERLDIDFKSFINIGEKTYNDIKDVPMTKAAAMIKKLSEFQNNIETIPAKIKKG